MVLKSLSTVVLALVGVLLMTACGSNIFSSSKWIEDPFVLMDSSADANVTVASDSLTTRLTANDSYSLTRGNAANAGDSVTAFADMRKVELQQSIALTLQVQSTQTLPSTITFRNVRLRITVRASDAAQGAATGTSVEFPYTGTIAFTKQADGSYALSNAPLTLNASLWNPDAVNLVAVLVSGSENTADISVHFEAETSSSSISGGSTVTLSLRFRDGRAIVRW